MENLFIEKVKTDCNGQFISSDVIKATQEQIDEFKSKPCNHSLNVDKLIYDRAGWPYDFRFCGICDEFLGRI